MKNGIILFFTSFCYLIIFVSLLFSQVPELVVQSSSGNILEVGVSIPDVKFTEMMYPDSNYYSVIVAPGSAILDVGNPDVPGISSWILIPNGNDVVLSVNPGSPKVFHNITLPPVLEPLPDISDSSTVKFTRNNDVYSSDKNYPDIFAEIEPIKNMRGQNITILWLYPYQYNPVTKILSVYEELIVTLDFIGVTESIADNLYDKGVNKLIQSIAINANEIIDAQNQANNGDSINNLDVGYEFLIITHDNFVSAANTLASWKNNLGISTIVKKTSDIGGTNTEIENYINNAYQNWNPAPSYLLLIGDVEYIPTWYENVHPYHDPLKTATDIYYADIQHNIADPIEDISYGRLPVDTELEAINLVNGIIAYESRSRNDAFFSQAAIAAYFQDNIDLYGNDIPDGIADRRFSKTAEDVRKYLNSNFFSVDRIYYTPSSRTPTNWSYWYNFENDVAGAPIPTELLKPGFPWIGSAVDIKSVVEAGRFLLLHRDHGGRTVWGSPYYGTSDIASLNNGEKKPIVWSLNCQTGWFDGENTGYSSESFAENWLRHTSGGSVGVIAPTRVTYSGHNDRLTWGFADAIWPDFIEFHNGSYGSSESFQRMGDVVRYGKIYYRTKYTNYSVRISTVEGFHWLGDPTMSIFPPPSISGYVNQSIGSAISGVTVTSSSGGTDVTDTNGYYSVQVPYAWTGTVTPSLSGWSFTPENIQYVSVISDKTNENYTGTYLAPCISGSIIYNTESGKFNFCEGEMWVEKNGSSSPNFEDFESYNTGSFPNNWVADANATNNSTNFIDSSIKYEGEKSLKLFGAIGACWGALAYRSIAFTSSFTVELAIRNSDESLSGCHPGRGYIGLRKGTSWSNPSRNLLWFSGDGNIKTGGGTILRTYSTNTWYLVKIKYEKVSATQIKLNYWINGSYLGEETYSPIADENLLDHLDLTAQEGSAWFDAISFFSDSN